MRLRDIIRIGARFRHRRTGRTVQVVQCHRFERTAEIAGELDARYLPRSRHQPVSFATLASDYELLVSLRGAR